jgi:hypothetical protein
MQLLAKENIPCEVIDALRQAGHDVAWVRAEAPGSRDEDVLWPARRLKTACFSPFTRTLASWHFAPTCGLQAGLYSCASPLPRPRPWPG